MYIHKLKSQCLTESQCFMTHFIYKTRQKKNNILSMSIKPSGSVILYKEKKKTHQKQSKYDAAEK